MKRAIKLSLVAALAGGAMLQAASVDIDGYRGGTLDIMFKGMTVIDDIKNGYAPSNGSGYLVKLKYESPDTLLDGLKYGVGVYVNGDAGLTNWDIKTAPEWDKGAYGMVVDKDGDSKGLLGELYLSYKHEYFDAKFGRQTLDTPLTKISTSLMPNFYEAYMLGTNVIEGLRLTAGHITKMSLGSRAATDAGIIGEGTGTAGVGFSNTLLEQFNGPIQQAKFYNIGTIANVDSTAGRTVLGATYTGVKDLKADLWVYHSDDIANDIYAEVGYKIPVSEGMAVNLNAQYLMQKDTGDSLAGERDFNMMGAKVALGTKKWGVFAAVNSSGSKDNGTEGQYFNAWGADPAYTSSIFSRNAYREDVDAYKVGAHYVIMKGLKLMVNYANYGKSTTEVSGKSAIDDAYEVDTILVYKPSKEWMFRIFNARRVSEFNGIGAFADNERRQNHYRLIASYSF
ncbi:OprD family porin [Sulfurimonas crateris]|uniref:OprD family porin n=1 Tax=Sulfurimonas crateris TaxID=2574727 RepID=A0A4U2Z9E2_9BACT|nr:OprD family outer membrane porin [Sulfurimonas crateris]TKI69621.1 OprD family porin [Sulfurimonas crateris]